MKYSFRRLSMENLKNTLCVEKIINCEKHLLLNTSQNLVQLDLLGFQNNTPVVTLYGKDKGLPIVALKDLKHLLASNDKVNKSMDVAVEREASSDVKIMLKEVNNLEAIKEIICVNNINTCKAESLKTKPSCSNNLAVNHHSVHPGINTNSQISKPPVIASNKKSVLQGKQVIIKTNSASGEKSLVFKQKTGANVEIPAKLSSLLKCPNNALTFTKSSECAANQNVPNPLTSITKILIPIRHTPTILKRQPQNLDCNLTSGPHISTKPEDGVKEQREYIIRKVIIPSTDHDYIVPSGIISSENQIIEIRDKVMDLKKPLISTIVTNKGLLGVSENKVLQPAKTESVINYPSVSIPSSTSMSYENKKVLKSVISSGTGATLIPVSALPSSAVITYANRIASKQMNSSNMEITKTQTVTPVVVSYRCTPKQINSTGAETVKTSTLQSILTKPPIVVSSENKLLKPVSSSSVQMTETSTLSPVSVIPSSIIINSSNEETRKAQAVPVQFSPLATAAVNYQLVNRNILKNNNVPENKSNTYIVMIANKDAASNSAKTKLAVKKKPRNIKPKFDTKTQPKTNPNPESDPKPEPKTTNMDDKIIKEDKSSQTSQVITATRDVETNTDDSLLDAFIEQRILERSTKNKVTTGMNTECIPIQHDIATLPFLDEDSDLLGLIEEASMNPPIIGDNVNFGTGPIIEMINPNYVGKTIINGKSIDHCTEYINLPPPTQGKTISNGASNTLPVNSVVQSGQLAMEPWKIQLFFDLKHCDQFDSTGNMPLHNAVMDNNIKMVKRQLLALRSRQFDVNTLNHESFTALQLALLYNADASIVQLVLQYGADISAVDSDGNNILHLCVMNSNENVMQTLLSMVGTNVDINSTNFDGYTPLILCALSKKHFMADALLAAGANPNIGDKKSGRTPLFHAVESNDVDMVKRLLNNNAKTKVRNFFGTSPHDAMFELDSVDPVMKRLILNKDEPNKFKEETRGRKRRKSESSNSSSTKIYSPKKPRSKPSS
ncbi:hypothetical protein ILUMI_26010 [Ignelater luminosus]|uniref:Uncharacterized protein n=1 Tax=Ignelater luminosus TaxID=2038154 RepID=A0A8K0C9B2_IGNLU|nr:hypothetical protein ILUMI_26010 [Ignelater luminosus]